MNDLTLVPHESLEEISNLPEVSENQKSDLRDVKQPILIDISEELIDCDETRKADEDDVPLGSRVSSRITNESSKTVTKSKCSNIKSQDKSPNRVLTPMNKTLSESGKKIYQRLLRKMGRKNRIIKMILNIHEEHNYYIGSGLPGYIAILKESTSDMSPVLDKSTSLQHNLPNEDDTYLTDLMNYPITFLDDVIMPSTLSQCLDKNISPSTSGSAFTVNTSQSGRLTPIQSCLVQGEIRNPKKLKILCLDALRCAMGAEISNTKRLHHTDMHQPLNEPAFVTGIERNSESIANETSSIEISDTVLRRHELWNQNLYDAILPADARSTSSSGSRVSLTCKEKKEKFLLHGNTEEPKDESSIKIQSVPSLSSENKNVIKKTCKATRTTARKRTLPRKHKESGLGKGKKQNRAILSSSSLSKKGNETMQRRYTPSRVLNAIDAFQFDSEDVSMPVISEVFSGVDTDNFIDLFQQKSDDREKFKIDLNHTLESKPETDYHIDNLQYKNIHMHSSGSSEHVLPNTKQDGKELVPISVRDIKQESSLSEIGVQQAGDDENISDNPKDLPSLAVLRQVSSDRFGKIKTTRRRIRPSKKQMENNRSFKELSNSTEHNNSSYGSHPAKALFGPHSKGTYTKVKLWDADLRPKINEQSQLLLRYLQHCSKYAQYFLCFHCDSLFTNIRFLHRHLRSFYDVGAFCPIGNCTYVSLEETEYLKHICSHYRTAFIQQPQKRTRGKSHASKQTTPAETVASNDASSNKNSVKLDTVEIKEEQFAKKILKRRRRKTHCAKKSEHAKPEDTINWGRVIESKNANRKDEAANYSDGSNNEYHLNMYITDINDIKSIIGVIDSDNTSIVDTNTPKGNDDSSAVPTTNTADVNSKKNTKCVIEMSSSDVISMDAEKLTVGKNYETNSAKSTVSMTEKDTNSREKLTEVKKSETNAAKFAVSVTEKNETTKEQLTVDKKIEPSDVESAVTVAEKGETSIKKVTVDEKCETKDVASAAVVTEKDKINIIKLIVDDQSETNEGESAVEVNEKDEKNFEMLTMGKKCEAKDVESAVNEIKKDETFIEKLAVNEKSETNDVESVVAVVDKDENSIEMLTVDQTSKTNDIEPAVAVKDETNNENNRELVADKDTKSD